MTDVRKNKVSLSLGRWLRLRNMPGAIHGFGYTEVRGVAIYSVGFRLGDHVYLVTRDRNNHPLYVRYHQDCLSDSWAFRVDNFHSPHPPF